MSAYYELAVRFEFVPRTRDEFEFEFEFAFAFEFEIKKKWLSNYKNRITT
jgi:hypothetical protein